LLLLAENDPSVLRAAGNQSKLIRGLALLKWPLIGLSIVISVWGFLWMYRLFVGFGWLELLLDAGLRS
jgi:hypothetical protein